MSGDCTDWDIWFQVLAELCPSWKVVALQSLARGARCLASGVDSLSEHAAEEIVHIINVERTCFELPVRLHVIGHSLGGIILRGAIPDVLKAFPEDGQLELGHYLSLSTPHLGICSSWRSPLHAWRNLVGPLTSCLTPQLAQLCVADGNPGRAYLLSLADPSGPFLAALRRFQCRTCVTVAAGDPLVPMASGIIDPQSSPREVRQPWRRRCSRLAEGAWTLQQRGAEENRFAPATLGRKASEPTSTPSNATGRFLRAEEPPSFHLEHCQRDGDDSGRTNSTRGSSCASASTATSWSSSRDGKCKYPDPLLEGLTSLPWRRLVVSLSRGSWTGNAHVFLIAKKRHQQPEEHAHSRACVELLAKALRE